MRLLPCRRAALALCALLLIAAGCAKRPTTVEVPAGSSFVVALTEPVSSTEKDAGDKFEARVQEPLRIDTETVVDIGQTVRGEVTNIVAGGQGATPSLTLVFREIVDASGIAHSIQARPLVVAGTQPAQPVDGGAPRAVEEPGSVSERAQGVAEKVEEVAKDLGDAAIGDDIRSMTSEPRPILEPADGPILVPMTDDKVELPLGQEMRVELVELTQLTI